MKVNYYIDRPKIARILLMGGVGNQLFQMGRAVTRRAHGEKVEIISLSKYQNMIFKFTGWSNHGDWVDIKGLAKNIGIDCRDITLIELAFLFLAFLLKKLGCKKFFDREYFDSFGKNKELESIIDAGYFQTKKHISEDSIGMISRALTQKLEIREKNNNDILAVHIRGGDFELEKRLNKSDVENISEFAEANSLNLVIVTNDKEFARSLFSDARSISFYEGKSAKEDFKYLCSASNLFISDSTFSLWAAFCSKSFGVSSIYAPQDFIFKDFLVLDHLTTRTGVT